MYIPTVKQSITKHFPKAHVWIASLNSLFSGTLSTKRPKGHIQSFNKIFIAVRPKMIPFNNLKKKKRGTQWTIIFVLFDYNNCAT